MSKFFNLLILAIVLLAMTGWLMHDRGDAISQDWQPLTTAPPALIQQFQKEIPAAEHNPDLLQSQFLKVMQPGQTAPLYLIDTSPTMRSGQRPALCGRMGCVFAAYRQQPGQQPFQQVSSGYLSQFLPPGTTKVEITPNLQNGFPCLKFNQLSQSRFDPELVSVIYCFDGNIYIQKSKEQS